MAAISYQELEAEPNMGHNPAKGLKLALPTLSQRMEKGKEISCGCHS
jgi:hypothetical protein